MRTYKLLASRLLSRLLDDSRRLVNRLVSLGITAEYVEYPGVVHMWMVMDPRGLPESRQAFQRASGFLSRVSQPQSGHRKS